jgi:hypothetical protein
VRVAFRVDKAPGGPRFRSRCAGSIVGVMQVAVVIISLLPMPTTLEPACCMLSAQEPEIHMSCELDPRLAERLVFRAIASLNPPRGNKVHCTRRTLHEAFLAVAQEARSWL